MEKSWEEKCDEVFCAWLKFKSDKYECILRLGQDSISVHIYSKNSDDTAFGMCDNENIVGSIDGIIDVINEYSDTNVVLDNIDFQQEKEEEMLTSAEIDMKAIEEVF